MVANGMGVEVRPDLEPERNLVRRADHWPFLQIDVPAVGFVFGYDPGTESERRYREWYTHRYHRPQDNLATPIDPKVGQTAINSDPRHISATDKVSDRRRP